METKITKLVQAGIAAHKYFLIKKEYEGVDYFRVALTEAGIKVRQYKYLTRYYDGKVLLYEWKKEAK